MTHSLKGFMLALAAAATLGGSAVAGAQASQRGQPKTPFGVADFAKLKWLAGSWEGTAPGEAPVYERVRFSNDSTIDITYYSDPAFSHESGTGRLYLSVGRVFHTFGPGRWGATRIDDDGVFFVPQVNARNTFAWKMESPDSWSSTTRSGVSGHDRVTVYAMKRKAP